MDTETLRKVQMVQLEILKKVDTVCKNNGIKYWLAGGTQLGAVRHNGFIPWDDDLDIAMLRQDYDRFIEIAQNELGDKYFLQTWDTDKYFALPIAKVRKNGTLFVEAGSQNGKLHQGIFIDVFPYDSWRENQADISKIANKQYLYYRLLLVKSHYSPWLNGGEFNVKKWFGYIPLRIISFSASKAELKRLYYNTQTADNYYTDSEYVFGSGEPQNVLHPMRRQVVENLILHRFEDMDAPIPENYNEYLTKAYGDYMKLPPENKRGNWHTVKKVEFGK